MKRFVSIFICVIMLIIPVTVFASDCPAETLIMMGDVNLDGKVNASDARQTLRIAANLDSKDGIDILSIDTDANGSVTSADARNILRKAASLSEFTYGFDGNGLANSLKALKNKKYSMSASYEDMTFTMVVDGDNIHLITSGYDISGGSLNMENIGVLVNDGKLYMTYTYAGSDIAMFVPESMYEDFEIDLDTVYEFSDIISNMLPDDFGSPEKVEVDGETMYCYAVDGEYNTAIYVDSLGCVKSIAELSSSDSSNAVVIDNFSADIGVNYFDMSRFSVM